MLLNSTVGFIGGGNMAEAIIKGLIAGGMAPRNIIVSDPVQDRRAFLPQPCRSARLTRTVRWPRKQS